MLLRDRPKLDQLIMAKLCAMKLYDRCPMRKKKRYRPFREELRIKQKDAIYGKATIQNSFKMNQGKQVIETNGPPIQIFDDDNNITSVKKVVRYDEDLGHQVIVEDVDEERAKLDRDIRSFLSEEMSNIDPKKSRNF